MVTEAAPVPRRTAVPGREDPGTCDRSARRDVPSRHGLARCRGCGPIFAAWWQRNAALRTRIERRVTRPPAPARTLTCRELVELLADYLAGDLGSDERGRIEGHLADCVECLAYLRSYRATVRTVREACRREDDMASLLPAALARAIIAARRARGR